MRALFHKLSSDSTVRTGAPPIWVEIGFPGEVRAYADRIHLAWEQFFDEVIAWVTVKGGYKKLDVKEAALLSTIRSDAAEFEEYRDKIQGFDPSPWGDYPSVAWEKLQVFEGVLKQDRLRYTTQTGKKLASPDVEDLENPGGEKQGLANIPWTGILIVAGIAGAAYALSSVAKISSNVASVV